MIQHSFFYFTYIFWAFFLDPDPDFQDRIWTKGPGSKTLVEIQQFNLIFNFERKLYGTKTMASEESSALRR